jgi:hypothetical protein
MALTGMPLVGVLLPQLKKCCTSKTTRVSCAAFGPCGCFFTRLISMKPAYHSANSLDLQPSRCGVRVRAYAPAAKPGSESARRMDT